MSKKLCLSAVLWCVLTMCLAAQDVLTIVRAVDAKEHSDTSHREMIMIVYPEINITDNKREFVLTGYSRGDDEYMEFVAPKTIKGLRVLSNNDDNWVYFPSTGRTRKIAGKSKKESVQGVGGDFSYEDIGGGKLEEKYDFRMLSEDAESWVLDGTSKKPDSVYLKAIITVNKNNYLMKKIEYHTKEEGHYKDLVFEDVKILGGREISTHMTMINISKDSKTEVIIRAAEYNIPIDDKFFNPARFGK